MNARIFGIALAMVAQFLPVSSYAEEPTWADGKLQPLADGWPDQALEVYVIDDPGTTDSIFANSLVEAASSRSPVPIKIEHRPDFSTYGNWEAQAWLMRQGELADAGNMLQVYTIPGGIADLLVTDMKTEAGVDLSDVRYVNMVEEVPYIIVQRADAPWGDTMADLIKYAKEHPNEVRWIMQDPGAGTTIAMDLYTSSLGFQLKPVVGGNGVERALAVASGDGDVAISQPDVALSHVDVGRMEILMFSGDAAAPAPWQDVPNAKAMGIEKDPWGLKRGLQVTTAVPEDHRAWLEELFRAAAADETFVASRKKTVPGIILNYRSGAEVQTYAQEAYDSILPFIQAAGVYWKEPKK